MIIKKFLEQLSNLGQSNQKDFYQWQLRKVKQNKIYSINDKKLKPIRSFLDNVKVSQNECYKNALNACLENEQIKYVEGYIIVHGVPIEHAWNSFNNIHFDLTEEILCHLAVEHFKIFELTKQKMINYSFHSGLTGPYSHSVFHEENEILKQIFEQ